MSRGRRTARALVAGGLPGADAGRVPCRARSGRAGRRYAFGSDLTDGTGDGARGRCRTRERGWRGGDEGDPSLTNSGEVRPGSPSSPGEPLLGFVTFGESRDEDAQGLGRSMRFTWIRIACGAAWGGGSWRRRGPGCGSRLRGSDPLGAPGQRPRSALLRRRRLGPRRSHSGGERLRHRLDRRPLPPRTRLALSPGRFRRPPEAPINAFVRGDEGDPGRTSPFVREGSPSSPPLKLVPRSSLYLAPAENSPPNGR